MNILIISAYPVINAGLVQLLNTKYSNLIATTSLDNIQSKLNAADNTLILYSLSSNTSFDMKKIIEFKQLNPSIKILIIDFNEKNEHSIFSFSKVGIEGYLLSTFSKEDLFNAIDKISSGHRHYDKDLIYKIMDQENINELTAENNNSFATPKDNPLTKRELQILSELAKGHSNYEISKLLNISENTVKKHMSNIFIKINVKDRTQATIYAYEMGIVS